MKNSSTNEKNNEIPIYLGFIIVFILILSLRVFNQGQQMSSSIERVQEEGFDLEDITTRERVEDEQVSFDKQFKSNDGVISFEYPSDWQEIENEEVLKLFQNPRKDGEQQLQESLAEDHVQSEDLGEMEFGRDDEALGDILFIGMKSTFPNLSVGIISVQKIEGVEDYEDLGDLLADNLEHEEEDNETRVSKREIGEDYIIIETLSSVEGRSVFKSRVVGFIVEDKGYILSLNSPYDTWSDFENEFNMIVSSIEINE